MNTIQCPNCGHRFIDESHSHFDDLLRKLRSIQRDYGAIKTKTLAAVLPVSEVTAWRTLHELEGKGIVYRKTKKTGYYLAC